MSELHTPSPTESSSLESIEATPAVVLDLPVEEVAAAVESNEASVFNVETLMPRLLDIKDWHFNTRKPQESAIFPGPKRLSSFDTEFVEFAKHLASEIQAAAPHDRSTYVVCVAGIRFRCQELDSGHFAVRTLKDKPIPSQELGFPKAYLDLLISSQLRNTGGIILICGATGSGKTTTASSALDAYLTTYGGYAMTLEDPPEYQLAGWHGENGYCDQIQIRRGNYREEMINALRGFPSEDRSILFMGEIRESIAASELLRIGVDGHLVMATMHADGPISAITRLLSIAKEEIGEVEARQLLSSSLKLVLHQRRDNQVPQLTSLRFDRPVDQPLRATISKVDGAIASLNNAISTQNIELSSAA